MIALALVLSLAAGQTVAKPGSSLAPDLQLLTRAAPSTTGEGFSLANARAVRITVCAASGQTLSGAGSLDSWYLRPGGAGTDWALGSVPLTIPSRAAGKRCFTFEDVPVPVRLGKALWAANGVTVSGGTQVTLYVDLGTAQ